MQMLSAQPLIDKFRSGSFEESEVGPYFVATLILQSLAIGSSYDLWTIYHTIANLAVTTFGLLYARKRNGNTFGDGFLSKWFSLAWVVSVRLALLMTPILFLLPDFFIQLFLPEIVVALTAVHYIWLGQLISATLQPIQPRQSDGGNSVAFQDSP